jgi:hypothetical protein
LVAAPTPPPVITITVREHQEMLIASQYHKFKSDTLEAENTTLRQKLTMLMGVAADDVKAEKIAGSQCCICMIHAATYIHVPCGHLCVCGACLVNQELGPPKCPLCRSHSTHIIKVFVE